MRGKAIGRTNTDLAAIEWGVTILTDALAAAVSGPYLSSGRLHFSSAPAIDSSSGRKFCAIYREKIKCGGGFGDPGTFCEFMRIRTEPGEIVVLNSD